MQLIGISCNFEQDVDNIFIYEFCTRILRDDITKKIISDIFYYNNSTDIEPNI